MKKGFTLAEVLMPKRTSGADNKVRYSRESDRQEPSNKIKKFAAFTLAEVLITLAIIGVVAALTIPVLVNKYQKNVLYTQFMKLYNNVTNAMTLTVVEHGDPQGWDWTDKDPIKEYIVPKLRVTKTCDTITDCFPETLTILGGGMKFSIQDISESTGVTTVTLQDGSVLKMVKQNDEKRLNFAFDTNGKKGPNVYGRDIFDLYYSLDPSNDIQFYFEEYDDENCNPSNSSSIGSGCASRLLQEGKMNY